MAGQPRRCVPWAVTRAALLFGGNALAQDAHETYRVALANVVLEDFVDATHACGLLPIKVRCDHNQVLLTPRLLPPRTEAALLLALLVALAFVCGFVLRGWMVL